MPAGIWSRLWHRQSDNLEQPGVISCAAAAGESLPRILELAARELLAAGRAARAGVWLVSADAVDLLEGVVVEDGVHEAMKQWRRLEIPAEEMRRLSDRDEMFPADVKFGGSDWLAGPLVGMRAALWLPVRVAGPSDGKSSSAPQGLALLAYHATERPQNLESVRNLLAELAVAVELLRMREESARNARAQADCAAVERAALHGVPVPQVLNDAAAKAQQHSGALFVAVVTPAAEQESGEGSVLAFVGPAEWSALVGDARIAAILRAAATTRKPAMESFEFPTQRDGWAEPFRAGHISAALAIPLEAGSQLLGLLVSGFSQPRSRESVLAMVELFAMPMALALQKRALEARHGEAIAACRLILEAASEEVLVVDGRGNILDASQTAQRHLGFELSSAHEIPLGSLLAPEGRAALCGWLAQPDANSVAIETPARDRNSQTSSLELRLKNGEALRVRAAGRSPAAPSGVRPGDETGLRWLLLERSESPAEAAGAGARLQAEFRDLLDSLDCGVLVFAVEEDGPRSAGRLRCFNARFAQMVGMEARSLEELSDFEALVAAIADRFRDPGEFSRRWREAVRAALEDEASWEELDLLRPTRKAVERYTRPVLDADGRRLGWLEVYRDITSQRMIQSKLLQTEKMAALGQLVSGIAHELNNPLTSIMGYTQLLMGRRGRTDRGTDAKHIFEEAERAGRIVKNLLLFAREDKPERKPVDLNEIVERTLALRSYELRVENIGVELQLAPDLPRTLADAHQLQQVVLNLIVNAEQAILQARGQGHIRVRTRLVAGNRLGLEVADDGPGVSPEIASRVFDPFFTTKPVGVGTGLGLSIVYGIVHEHGGEVYVESAPGQGATFVVELPVAARHAATAEPEQEVQKEIEVAVTTSLSGHRILVVEDEPTVAQLIVDVLGEDGHQVEAVLDSQEGLDRLSQDIYDLVICDLRMPRFDGRAFHQALVRAGNPAQDRMLFVTGDTLSPRTLEFLERRHLPYLAKPFLVEELKSVVNLILERLAGEKRAESRRSATRRTTGVTRTGNALAVGERREVVRKQ